MKLLLDVLNKKPCGKTPIWFMRQAGRYLPEYRELRKNFRSFVEFCLTPDAASEATIQPLKRFDIDAAIIFSDILIIPHALGFNVEFKEGIGPVIDDYRKYDFENIEYCSEKQKVFQKVFDTIVLTKKVLDKSFTDKTLIGFCGAPWTVAAYIIEGGGSKDFLNARLFALRESKKFSKLIDLITDASIEYLKGQIRHGADVIKIFDSWAGLLFKDQYMRFVIEPTKKIVSEVKKEYPNVPIICFPKNSSFMYREYMDHVLPDCLSFDSSVPLSYIRELQNKCVVQGNFDNVLLTGDKSGIKSSAESIMNELSSGNFVFNLGHGVLPITPIDNVQYLIEIVRNSDLSNKK